jgi:hypothetical protein
MKVTPEQLKAVTKLPGPARYNFFVKKVADWQQAWSLFSDGWAVVADDAGKEAVPLWPAKEYAEACATKDWALYEARPFALEDLLTRFLPQLVNDGMTTAIFVTPQDKGLLVPPEQLRADLEREMERYRFE